MLPRNRSTFKLDEEKEQTQMSVINCKREVSITSKAVGLRILIQNSSIRSNVVVKSSLRSPPTSGRRTTKSSSLQGGFLQLCNLCSKKLNPKEDIYMYKGDQGFCSVQCRNRQIYIDEMRAAEEHLRKRKKLPSCQTKKPIRGIDRWSEIAPLVKPMA